MKAIATVFDSPASPFPPGEGKAPTVVPTPSTVGAAFSSDARPGNRAAVSTLNQPCADETAAANSFGVVGERCSAFPIPAGLRACLFVGSESEGASPRPAGFDFSFEVRSDDPTVLMNIETLRVSVTKLMCAKSSSA